MPTENISPVTRKGSKVGSNQSVNPGAKSNPSRARGDSVPEQQKHQAPPVKAHGTLPEPSLGLEGREE